MRPTAPFRYGVKPYRGLGPQLWSLVAHALVACARPSLGGLVPSHALNPVLDLGEAGLDAGFVGVNPLSEPLGTPPEAVGYGAGW